MLQDGKRQAFSYLSFFRCSAAYLRLHVPKRLPGEDAPLGAVLQLIACVSDDVFALGWSSCLSGGFSENLDAFEKVRARGEAVLCLDELKLAAFP